MFRKFPPKDYPIHFSITFGKRETGLKTIVKTVLNTIPKNKAKYHNTGKYVNTFDCYFKDTDSLRPLLNDVLRDTEMFIQYLLEPEKRVFINDIISKSNDVLNERGIS